MMTYTLTVTSNSDSDIQPEVAALNSPMVLNHIGVDTDKVRVTLTPGTDVAEFESMLDADPDVKRYSMDEPLPVLVIARWKAEDWNADTMTASAYTYYASDNWSDPIDLTEDQANQYNWGTCHDDATGGGSQSGSLRA